MEHIAQAALEIFFLAAGYGMGRWHERMIQNRRKGRR